jgi:hypothetical protein
MRLRFQDIRNLDAFPRAQDHLVQKTSSGAAVSIIGLIIMATLFVHELRFYLQTVTVHEMSVDVKRGEKLPIHINMTFPALPCDGAFQETLVAAPYFLLSFFVSFHDSEI